jgi:hypothetical protein
MTARPNGEPFVDVINFGSHYCSMWRWDDADQWRILVDKKGCRRIFSSISEAVTETKRAKMGDRSIRAPAAESSEPDMITAWRKEKAQDVETERARVFGGGKPKIVWANGRAVPVERRRIA